MNAEIVNGQFRNNLFQLRWFYYFLCALIIFHCYVPIYASGAKEKIIIPPEERTILEKFFRKLLFSQGFAYTLFADKPISVDDFDFEESRELFHVSSKGYHLWKKYAHRFPSKNYIFLFYENKNECEITLINKPAFRRIAQEHRNKFAELFGSDFQTDSILQLIIEKQSLWNTPMKDRDDLIGILLGYGKKNAELFHKRNEILRRSTPSQGYASVEEELDDVNTSLHAFSDEGRFSLCFMPLPGFAANSKDPETILLKQKYKKLRRRITQHCAQGNILDITLEHLSK
jgi:hypothetical protein